MSTALAWMKCHLVSILAVVAAAGVLSSWVLDVFVGLKPIGTLHVAYDLCLAYLTGWLFHLLVVVIPRRRKVRSIMDTLRGNLMTIANNGPALIHDLEYVGRCPERPVTDGHVSKVLTANGQNDLTMKFMSTRLSVARDAYRRVTPFLTSLPSDVAIAVQTVDQQVINFQLNAPDQLDLSGDSDSKGLSHPGNLRAPEAVSTFIDGVPVQKRQTLHGWKTLILDYFEATERLRTVVKPYLRGAPRYSERVDFWTMYKINDRHYPFSDYPEEASTDAWT